MKQHPINAASVPAVMGQTIYPAPFAAVVSGRLKRKLGNEFGLSNFGVNLTELQPGSASALAHSHTVQDEFIYVLNGTLTLVLDGKEHVLSAGDCCGFKAGTGLAHRLLNRSDTPVSYLEIGDRTPGDTVDYPDDDLKATQRADGSWAMTRKNGQPHDR
jgi:uncharacterized cupin superfamily protein